jgi:hypothetical protein
LLLCASEVVLQPLDVVFSEISSALNLYEDKNGGSNVFYPMRRAGGNVDCSAALDDPVLSVEGDAGRSGDNHPVFRSMLMFLITEALLRKDFDALHFVVGRRIENRKTSPRTFVTQHGVRIYRCL